MPRLQLLDMRPRSVLLAVVLVALVTSCGLESPIRTTDRPLSERLETRRQLAEEQAAEAAATSTTTTTSTTVLETAQAVEDEAPAVAADGAEDEDTPDGLAFADPQERVVTITGSPLGLSMRAGPGQGYDLLVAIPSDSVFVATGNRTGEWDHVRYGTLEGWVKHRNLVDAPEGATPGAGSNDVSIRSRGVPYVVIGKGSGGGVNVREEPSVSAKLVSSLVRGTEVRATGSTSGPWIEITHDDVTGWSWAAYLEPK